MDKRVRSRIWLSVVALLALIPLTLAAMLTANGVDTDVGVDDRRVIDDLDLDGTCRGVDEFEDQLRCIESVQATIAFEFPDTSDSFQKGETGHEPGDYATRGYGPCYDRARLIEQTLRHYGFDARRIALYERQRGPWNYLRPGIRSHALTEVETARGWVVVDSVKPFVAVDYDQKPWTIDELRDGLADGAIDDETFASPIPDDLFDGEFIYVQGLHSRHGYFFEPHLPVPEINWEHFGISRI